MLKIFFLFQRLVRFAARMSTARRLKGGQVRSKGLAAPARKALSESELRSQIHTLPSARVKFVIDGDTVIVSKGWREIRIRLDSIDCPEDGQEWGDIARYGLMKMINRRIVHLEEHGRDDYGRTLATLYVRHPKKPGWLNVNERMVVLGHAWVMRHYYGHLPDDRKDKLNYLERWARSRSVGLWRAPDPIPPWQWRNGR
jgi:endonuclease YncB( thermonuclease family)